MTRRIDWVSVTQPYEGRISGRTRGITRHGLLIYFRSCNRYQLSRLLVLYFHGSIPSAIGRKESRVTCLLSLFWKEGRISVPILERSLLVRYEPQNISVPNLPGIRRQGASLPCNDELDGLGLRGYWGPIRSKALRLLPLISLILWGCGVKGWSEEI